MLTLYLVKKSMTQRDGTGREEGSGWGTRVYLWWTHVDIWKNQYNIVKLKNKIKKEKQTKKHNQIFRSVQFSPVAQSCPTLCNPVKHSTWGLPVHYNSWSSPKPMSIESVMPSNHLIFCRSLLLLPSIFPSIRGFSNKSVLHIRWPKYWSLVSNISCQWCCTGNKMALTF